MLIKAYNAIGACEIHDDIESVIVYPQNVLVPRNFGFPNCPMPEGAKNLSDMPYNDKLTISEVYIDSDVFDIYQRHHGHIKDEALFRVIDARIKDVSTLPKHLRIDKYRRYYVHQLAYICNDRGQTIQKVELPYADELRMRHATEESEVSMNIIAIKDHIKAGNSYKFKEDEGRAVFIFSDRTFFVPIHDWTKAN